MEFVNILDIIQTELPLNLKQLSLEFYLITLSLVDSSLRSHLDVILV